MITSDGLKISGKANIWHFSLTSLHTFACLKELDI
jgi:hypothetical protein